MNFSRASAAASIWIAASIVPVAIDRTMPGPPADASVSSSATQKDAEIKPLVSSATDCIARTVSADPRLPLLEAPQVNDLIVASMPKCVNALCSMIDSYDTLYGEGTGEKFLWARISTVCRMPSRNACEVMTEANAKVRSALIKWWPRKRISAPSGFCRGRGNTARRRRDHTVAASVEATRLWRFVPRPTSKFPAQKSSALCATI